MSASCIAFSASLAAAVSSLNEGVTSVTPSLRATKPATPAAKAADKPRIAPVGPVNKAATLSACKIRTAAETPVTETAALPIIPTKAAPALTKPGFACTQLSIWPKSSVPSWYTKRIIGKNCSPTLIFNASAADWASVISPCRLSSLILAIRSAAPLQLFMLSVSLL